MSLNGTEDPGYTAGYRQAIKDAAKVCQRYCDDCGPQIAKEIKALLSKGAAR